MNESLLSIEQVMEITTLKRSSLYTLIQSGNFPKQIKIGKRKSRWNKHDIIDWLKKKGVDTNLDLNNKNTEKSLLNMLEKVLHLLEKINKTVNKCQDCNGIGSWQTNNGNTLCAQCNGKGYFE